MQDLLLLLPQQVQTEGEIVGLSEGGHQMARRGYEIKEEQMLDAIQNSGGIYSTIAAHLVPLCGRKPDWNTIRDYVNKWESTQKAVETNVP